MFQCSLFPFAGIESFPLTAGRRRRACGCPQRRGQGEASHVCGDDDDDEGLIVRSPRSRRHGRHTLAVGWLCGGGGGVVAPGQSPEKGLVGVDIANNLVFPPPPQMVCVSSHPWKEGRGAFAGGRKTRFNGPGGFTKVDCVRMYVLSMYVGVHRRPSRQPSRQSVRTDVRTHVYKVKPSNPPVGVQKATR